MKLSYKIFLGICIPSIIAILVVSSVLIMKNFEINIQRETNRSIEELKIIETSIQRAIQNNNDAEQEYIIKVYIGYYRDKETGILVYDKGGKQIYKNKESLVLNNTEILNVSEEEFLTTIQNVNGKYYIYISTILNYSQVLIYVRDISSIFEIRRDLIQLSSILVVVIIIIIAIVAYLIAKKITKPLNDIQKEIVKLSNGNYNINLKEEKNEFGKLAKSFNQMSRELEYRNNELIEMINSKQIFIDNLSHEINTPLTSILGYAELLERASCTEEQKIKFLSNIQEEAKRINDIHKKLLLLSYKKNSDFIKQNISMKKILGNIGKALYIKIEEYKISLVINNNIDSIYGDETLITISISNLISNAINASNNGSKIIINTFEKDDKQYIQVIDEGQGISEENIRKITEPFYRVDKARNRKSGGAGLGLSICTSIMEMHNGSIEIESEIGKGSIFTLIFPKNLQL